MKIKKLVRALLLVVIMLAVNFITAEAAPLENVPLTLSQPDGSKFECYASGDEFFNYLHNKDGDIIIQDEQGWYVLAENEEGKPVATGRYIGEEDPFQSFFKSPSAFSNLFKKTMKLSDIDFEKHPEMINRALEESVKYGSEQDQFPEGMANLCMFIRFSDETEFVGGAVFDPRVGTRSFYDLYSGDNNASIKAYFKAISNNQFQVMTTFASANGSVMASYRDIYPRGYYMKYSAVNQIGYKEDFEGYEREEALLGRALAAAAPNIPTGTKLDYNADGEIDNVTFLVSGDVAAWGSVLWPHQSWLYSESQINGLLAGIYNFNFAADPAYASLYTISHELCHVVGFPDLYRYYSTGIPVGYWDIMGASNTNAPQFPNSYSRRRYGGWGETKSILKDGVYSLKAVDDPTAPVQAYRIVTGDKTESFYVEFRRSGEVGNVSRDNAPGTGLIVYRVNPAAYGNVYGEVGGSADDEVYVMRPNDPIRNSGEGDLEDAFLNDAVGRISFGTAANVVSYSNALYFSSGVNSRIVIKNVVMNGSEITFEVEYGKPLDLAVPGGRYNVADKDWTIAESGTYTFYGNSSANTITVYEDVKDVNIILESVNMSATEENAPILLQKGADVKITLPAGSASTLRGGYSAAGIQVSASSHLTIDGNGRLDAFGGEFGAGIGGGGYGGVGTINVSGGTVKATGGEGGAGIGGGLQCSGGKITISNSTVEAIGGEVAAGIGGGIMGDGGEITITDSTVTATGGIGGAGIGGGALGGGGVITIRGGIVKATGGRGEAESIEEDGEKIVVILSQGAGIGGGGGIFAYEVDGELFDMIGGRDGATLTVSGSYLTTSSIGSGGWNDNGGTAKIVGGSVKAIGDAPGANAAFTDGTRTVYPLELKVFSKGAYSITVGDMDYTAEANSQGEATIWLPAGSYTVNLSGSDYNGSHSVNVFDNKINRLTVKFSKYVSYISGYVDGTFDPEKSITRAEAAKLFHNLLVAEGMTPEIKKPGAFFLDVLDPSEWYYEAVMTLAKMGVITGYDDGSFRPEDRITRAEFTTMVARFYGLAAETGDTGFNDVPGSHWAAGHITAAFKAGYIEGKGAGFFAPEEDITRAEAVTLINRKTGRAVGSDTPPAGAVSFTDVAKEYWAYTAIIAAANDYN